MNITIKDIPERLHTILRAQAEENGRSLNKQILYCLSKVCIPTKADRKELLDSIRTRRNSLDIHVDDESLNLAKQKDRK